MLKLAIIKFALLLTVSSRPESPTIDPKKNPNFCLHCVDEGGFSCDGFMTRFGKSRYWIIKGGPREFSDAETTCTEYDKVVARMDSESESDEFKRLTRASGGDSYWAVNGEGQSIVVDKEGNAQPNSEGQHVGVCMWADGHHCLNPKPATSPKPGPEPDKDCPQPMIADGNRLIRTGHNSKYLYPEQKFFTTWEEAKSLCEKYDLQLASMSTLKDFMHLKDDWIRRKKLDEPKTRAFYAAIALKFDSNNDDGAVKDVNTGRAAAITLFDVNQPGSQDACTALKAFYGTYSFELAPCSNRNFMPLCQYKTDTDCYKKSPLTIYEEEELDELHRYGSTDTREYYGSSKQKTMKAATEFCEQNKMKLLDFIKNDTIETTRIWSIVSNYQTQMKFPYQIGKSWTSGVFSDGFEVGKEFTFESSGERWTYEDSRKHFQWMDEGIFEEERCLVLAKPQQLRPIRCNLANFFLCYKWRDGKDPASTPPPPTEVPPTNETEENATTPTNCKGDPTILSFNPDGMTKDEVLGLISLSENLNFSGGYSSVLKIKEESTWRTPHIKAFGTITKHVCPDPYIEEEFINVLMNFIMIYYNSIPERPRTESSKLGWERMLTRYKKCKNMSDPFPFLMRGGMIIGVDMSKVVNVPDSLGKIAITKEVVDNGAIFNLDIILEGLWYMFEVAAGSCYNLAKWKTTWLAEFFYSFRNDFTEPFKDWWISPGVQNYGLLFGDIDLSANLYNLRACAVAVFQRTGIMDKLPVRPLLTNETYSFKNNLNMRLQMSYL